MRLVLLICEKISGILFIQAILNWCRAKCQADGEEDQREAVRQKLSRFLDYIKWENMSGMKALFNRFYYYAYFMNRRGVCGSGVCI